MKLIPPTAVPESIPAKAADTKPTPQTEDVPRIDATFTAAMSMLTRIGGEFTDELEKAVKRLAKTNQSAPARALAQILEGVTSAVRGITKGEIDVRGNGHATSDSAASDGNGKRRRGRPRKVASGAADSTVARSTGDTAQPVKRGRGRPKGSKNRATLEREQRAAQKPAAGGPARKRGRPRKVVPAAPQRRGRPTYRTLKATKPGELVKTLKAIAKRGKSVRAGKRGRTGGRQGAAKKSVRTSRAAKK